MASKLQPTPCPRFQVLWNAEPPKTGMEFEDFNDEEAANKRIEELRAQGKVNVHLWNTSRNPISNMFRL